MKTKPEKITPPGKAPKIPELKSQLTDLKARQGAAKKRALGARDAHKRAKKAYKLAKRDAKAVRKKVKAVKRVLEQAMVAAITPRIVPAKKRGPARKKGIRRSKLGAEALPRKAVVVAQPLPIAASRATAAPILGEDNSGS